MLLLSHWVCSSLFDLSRSDGILQVSEAEPGVSADRLKKQTPGKRRQRGRTRHSRAFRQRKKLPRRNRQALLHPCPRAPGLHLQIRHRLSPPLLFQVLLPSFQPTPSLLQLLIAGNILQPLPSCTAVCLSVCSRWCPPSKNTSAPLLAI